MGFVKVLNKQLSNMIAAGEVVERPASVVKELVENSIDSGAKNIVVEIKNGGKTYIRVTDDGCGMSKEDALASFQRHATSKIQSVSDLFRIKTMGFRGEALAAISSVSRMEMLTSQSVEQYGVRILMDGGEEVLCEDVGIPSGTTVIVRDLFYNTPARMNFMKKDSTETSVIVGLVQKLALANYFISFKLIVDGKEKLQTGNDCGLNDLIYTLFGSELSDKIIPINRSVDGTSVVGYVSTPKCLRANRNYQFLFVNKRVVRSKTVTAAIDRAYSNLMMNGKHPATFIYIDMPYTDVDVNVHPTKSEIKFLDESEIFDLVYYAIKDALSQDHPVEPFSHLPSVNELSYASKSNDIQTVKEPVYIEQNTDEYLTSDAPMFNKEFNQTLFETPDAESSFNLSDFQYNYEPANLPLSNFNSTANGNFAETEYLTRTVENTPYLNEPKVSFKYIGEVFDTYAIIECGESMYLVDKHAAHERMLFNDLFQKYKESDKYSQGLLVGLSITLIPEEADVVRNNLDAFKKLGYEMDEFGDNDFVIRSAPLSISPDDVEDSFRETVAIFSENKTDELTSLEVKVIKMMACKAAIKGGIKTSHEELEKFISKVLNSDDVKYCPHGRPIFYEYSKRSIEKDFKRIV